MKILSAHFNLLPYHAARYEAFMRHADAGTKLTSVLFRTTEEYKLIRQEQRPDRSFEIIRPDLAREAGAAALAKQIGELINSISPDVILLPGGYVEPEMRHVIRHAALKSIPMILCSATKQDDATRVWWREFVKQRLVGMFSAFLVGGTPHRSYFRNLGADPERIRDGYDVVDNAHFSSISDAVRSGAVPLSNGEHLPADFFVTTVRFAPEKNLICLLDAYRTYRNECTSPWDLVILGDGKLRPQIEAHRRKLGLDESVHLPGFKQYDELPRYYAKARAMILASSKEPWGLVVNEAMACSLPVLVSKVCGCAPDLVSPGENGFIFDPADTRSISGAMRSMSEVDEEQYRMMVSASRSRVDQWGPDRFAKSLSETIQIALNSPRGRPGVMDRLLLTAYARA